MSDWFCTYDPAKPFTSKTTQLRAHSRSWCEREWTAFRTVIDHPAPKPEVEPDLRALRRQWWAATQRHERLLAELNTLAAEQRNPTLADEVLLDGIEAGHTLYWDYRPIASEAMQAGVPMSGYTDEAENSLAPEIVALDMPSPETIRHIATERATYLAGPIERDADYRGWRYVVKYRTCIHPDGTRTYGLLPKPQRQVIARTTIRPVRTGHPDPADRGTFYKAIQHDPHRDWLHLANDDRDRSHDALPSRDYPQDDVSERHIEPDRDRLSDLHQAHYAAFHPVTQ